VVVVSVAAVPRVNIYGNVHGRAFVWFLVLGAQGGRVERASGR
jgi:hypothetical protein